MQSHRRRPSKLVWAEDYKRFRQRLVAAREELGLSQRAAAKLLGRSASFVAKSETGERRVDVVELRHFARTYGKPLDYFLS